MAEGGLLEWAEFAGNCYGTPRAPVEQQLAQGRPVLLEIELEGARQVRRSFPSGFQIFLAPPSFEELERRIRGRGTDAEEAIQRRLTRAQEELKAQDEFDAVVNDDLGHAHGPGTVDGPGLSQQPCGGRWLVASSARESHGWNSRSGNKRLHSIKTRGGGEPDGSDHWSCGQKFVHC